MQEIHLLFFRDFYHFLHRYVLFSDGTDFVLRIELSSVGTSSKEISHEESGRDDFLVRSYDQFSTAGKATY